VELKSGKQQTRQTQRDALLAQLSPMMSWQGKSGNSVAIRKELAFSGQ